MNDINRHGLSRHIPEEIARKVRQECGFGCVLCGMALYHYHHISPEFKDARSHDPANIALLCATHHDLVTRGHLSNDKVSRARLEPKSEKQGFAAGSLEVGSESFKVVIGGATFGRGACIGFLGEPPLLLLLPPEEPGETIRVTAFFPASDGGWSLAIFRNEWRVLSQTVWDVKVEGPKITIRRKTNDIVLQFRTNPPHIFEVLNLNIRTDKYSASVDSEGLVIAPVTGQPQLRFGPESRSTGVLGFTTHNQAVICCPFPASVGDAEVSWRDVLLNQHWVAGRQSHGNMVIRPDGNPPKRSEGTTEFHSLKLFDQTTGELAALSEEAEVFALFSFGSPHCQFLPVGAEAIGPV